MGDPVTTPLIIASIVTTVAAGGVTAYSQIEAGKATASAAEMERAQYEEQKTIANLQALDEENDRNRRLRQVMATNTASAIAAGLNPDGSRSFLNIQRVSEKEAARDINRIRLNAAGVNRNLTLSAEQAKTSGKNALKAGYLGATSTVLSTGASAASMGASAKSPKKG